MDHSAEFDIIVAGATGYAGALTTAALAGHAPSFLSLSLPAPPAGVRFALMGRREATLRQLASAKGCRADTGFIAVADHNDADQLAAAVSRGRVVLNCLATAAKAERRALVRNQDGRQAGRAPRKEGGGPGELREEGIGREG